MKPLPCSMRTNNHLHNQSNNRHQQQEDWLVVSTPKKKLVNLEISPNVRGEEKQKYVNKKAPTYLEEHGSNPINS